MSAVPASADSIRRLPAARRAARMAPVLAFFVLSGAPLAVAAGQQPAPAAPLAPVDSIQPQARPGEDVRRRVEELRRRRLAEYLRLDEERAAEMEAELRAFRARQEALRLERQRLLEELRRVTEREAVMEPELRRHLDALRRNEEERERSLRELRENLSRGLTLEQQARLQLFAERFAREMRDRVERLRDDRRPPVRPAPPAVRRPTVGPTPPAVRRPAAPPRPPAAQRP